MTFTEARGSVAKSVVPDLCRADRHGFETRPTHYFLPVGYYFPCTLWVFSLILSSS